MFTSTRLPLAPPNLRRLVHLTAATPPFCLAAAASVAVILFVAAPARGTTITFTESGTSIIGTPLSVSALIQTAADAGGPNNALRITLRSFGAPSRAPADVLSSLYFNIADPNTGVRPNLTYVSGSGQAYQVRSGATDTNVSWTPQTWTTTGTGAAVMSNLVAINNYDEGWQFKTLTPPPAFPGLGFGIGTVGNADIWKFIPGGTSGNPEGFDGLVVRGISPSSMINLGIYSTGTGTDIDPVGTLDGARVVRTEATFLFSSDKDLDSLTQTWVQGNVTFGFGTNPDSVLLPEPSSQALAGVAGLSALGTIVLRMRRFRVADRRR